MKNRTQDAVGIVLTRNEVWLLLNALNAAAPPALLWSGDPLEPWHLGDLNAKLRAALHPDPVKDIDERPIIPLDSEMGTDLAIAGVKPLVVSEGYDVGSLLVACAERGWGAELVLPRGAHPATPATATVHARRDRGPGQPDEATYHGLERPVVAMARALIGALVGARAAEDMAGDGLFEGADARIDPTARRFDEYVIWAASIGRGQKQRVIDSMAKRGWDLVADEIGQPNGKLVFRRPAQAKTAGA